jgi:hypothetical protein
VKFSLLTDQEVQNMARECESEICGFLGLKDTEVVYHCVSSVIRETERRAQSRLWELMVQAKIK